MMGHPNKWRVDDWARHCEHKDKRLRMLGFLVVTVTGATTAALLFFVAQAIVEAF